MAITKQFLKKGKNKWGLTTAAFVGMGGRCQEFVFQLA